MKTVFDNAVTGVAVIVLAAVLLFLPSFVANFCKIQALRSVSALKAMTLLLAVFCIPWWWRTTGLLLVTLAIWLVATIWSVMGKRRDG